MIRLSVDININIGNTQINVAESNHIDHAQELGKEPRFKVDKWIQRIFWIMSAVLNFVELCIHPWMP